MNVDRRSRSVWLQAGCLGLAFLATVAFLSCLPKFLDDYRLLHYGRLADGRYLNLDENEPCVAYEYKVEDKTYRGCTPWANQDGSDIYTYRPGDHARVWYLAERPWISASPPSEEAVRQQEAWLAFCLFGVLLGLSLLYVVRRRSLELLSPAPSTPPSSTART